MRAAHPSARLLIVTASPEGACPRRWAFGHL